MGGRRSREATHRKRTRGSAAASPSRATLNFLAAINPARHQSWPPLSLAAVGGAAQNGRTWVAEHASYDQGFKKLTGVGNPKAPPGVAGAEKSGEFLGERVKLVLPPIGTSL